MIAIFTIFVILYASGSIVRTVPYPHNKYHSNSDEIAQM